MLTNLYYGGTQPFYFMLFGTDSNKRASTWMGQYSLYYVPTVYWDGGYRVKIGGSGYSTDINVCKVRAVADVDIDLKVYWLGDGDMNIVLEAKNNGPFDYSGLLRVYVAEILSSYGYKDSSGKLYNFPFLDFALKTSVTIPGNGTYKTSTFFDGALHNDGFGHTFNTTQKDNIIVIAALCNSTPHTNYSNPPSGAPFNAYYLDDCVGTTPSVLGIDNLTLPVSGGKVTFNLDGGRDEALRNYFLLGSASGTEPGLPLPGGLVTLPLNWDALTDMTIGLANSPALVNSHGVLDNFGDATAILDSNGPLPPTALGLVVDFAFLLYYPTTYFPYDYVSNSVSIEIVP